MSLVEARDGLICKGALSSGDAARPFCSWSYKNGVLNRNIALGSNNSPALPHTVDTKDALKSLGLEHVVIAVPGVLLSCLLDG